ncbi:MAG: flagellar basal body P-ring formation protein FlgA, partial [bacterium]|nr:flagellar basal body P-ring formation protein FlgA [bacterium]
MIIQHNVTYGKPAKIMYLSVILLIVAVCLPAADTFVLKDNAVVSDRIVRMKDIALMDTPTKNRIGALVIAVSPEMGASSTIKKEVIYKKLIGNGINSPQLNGADLVKITRKGTIVKPSFFKEQIHNYIVTHSRWKEGLTIEMVTKKEIVVPVSGVRWQLTPANGQDFFGNVLFKIRAFSGSTNEEIYSNWIVVKLKITKLVAVSNRTINKNERLAAGDLRWEPREINVYTKDAILIKEEIIGQKAGRIIRPNSIITTGLLAKKYMVRRGAVALLIARLKSVTATSNVKVLANGGLGDTIRVLNLTSKRI